MKSLICLGECGHQPAVRVWDLQSEPQSGHPGLSPQVQQVAEFLSHKYGISCVVSTKDKNFIKKYFIAAITYAEITLEEIPNKPPTNR